MWWSRRLLPVLLLMGLAACGFRPVYGDYSYNRAASSDLAQVHVDNIEERSGQLIRNALLHRINPHGESDHPTYHLYVNVTETETQQALRKDDTATRNQVAYSVIYKLYYDKTMVDTGAISKVFSYDFLEEHYADISAEDDIRHRAAEELAEELRNRLTAYFVKAARHNA